MKKVFLCLMLLCGIAMISTSCKKDPTPVNPETASGSMTVGNKTIDITTAEAVNYGQKNAIVLASKPMTEAENEGVAVIFNGAITPGTYKLGDAKADTPRVVGLKDFNMGEIRFVIESDTIFFGDAYFWISKRNTIVVNEETMQSSVGDLYAGGDIVRGGATVILAMGDGRRAALNMANALLG